MVSKPRSVWLATHGQPHHWLDRRACHGALVLDHRGLGRVPDGLEPGESTQRSAIVFFMPRIDLLIVSLKCIKVADVLMFRKLLRTMCVLLFLYWASTMRSLSSKVCTGSTA